MENTKTPMKDKETKEKFDDLLMEVMGSYHDFMMNKISLNKHKAVEQKVGDFIKGVEQDTTEEWVEGLRKLMSTWGKVLYVNKGRIGKGMQTDMYTRFYKFVKQLLDDREREAYHDGYTDGVTRCMDSLNKLEEDKNEGA